MKPMLSATALALNDLRYPLLASPKLDGVRALVVDGKLVTRQLEPVANRELAARYSHTALNGLDGELILGTGTQPDAFQETSAIVRSRDKDASLVLFHVFDNWCAPGTFPHRHATLTDSLELGIIVVRHTTIYDAAELAEYEAQHVGRGYEGVMTRSIDGLYKHGRSTLKEQGLVKVKQFCDDEAEILEVIEMQLNTNAAERDLLGHVKRSTHKEGKVGKSMVGAFKVKGSSGPHAGKIFHVGAGTLKEHERIALWSIRDKLLGGLLTFKYFPTGSKELPRFPLFLRWPHGNPL